MSITKAPQSKLASPVVAWYEVYSKEHGRYYYFHPETNESTWILPDDDHPNPCQCREEAIYSSSSSSDARILKKRTSTVPDGYPSNVFRKQGHHNTRSGGDSTQPEIHARQRRVMVIAGLLLLVVFCLAATPSPHILSNLFSQKRYMLEPKDATSSTSNSRNLCQNHESLPRQEDPIAGRDVPSEKIVPEQHDLSTKKDNHIREETKPSTATPQDPTDILIHTTTTTTARPTSSSSSSLGEDILRSLEQTMEETLGVRVVIPTTNDPTIVVTDHPNETTTSSCFIPFGYFFLPHCRPATFDAEAFVMTFFTME